jgi:hypothetical protein
MCVATAPPMFAFLLTHLAAIRRTAYRGFGKGGTCRLSMFRMEKTAGTAARYIVCRLCSEWAALLMGDGFGTGDYSMYGAFMVDLDAHTVTDDRVADPEGHRASKLASW